MNDSIRTLERDFAELREVVKLIARVTAFDVVRIREWLKENDHETVRNTGGK